jgi:hypothetical protein
MPIKTKLAGWIFRSPIYHLLQTQLANTKNHIGWLELLFDTFCVGDPSNPADFFNTQIQKVTFPEWPNQLLAFPANAYQQKAIRILLKRFLGEHRIAQNTPTLMKLLADEYSSL